MRRTLRPQLIGPAFAGLALLLAIPEVFAARLSGTGKVGTDVTKPGPTIPSGVTDTVILPRSSLSSMGGGFAGRKMRMRTS